MRDIAFTAQILHLEELKQTDTSFNRTAVEIVTALQRALGCSWEVRASDDVALNNLMRDRMLKVASIDRSLGAFSVYRRSPIGDGIPCGCKNRVVSIL